MNRGSKGRKVSNNKARNWAVNMVRSGCMPVISDALAIRENHLRQMKEQLQHQQLLLRNNPARAASDRVLFALAREVDFTERVIKELLAIKKVFGRQRQTVHRRIASR